MKKNLTLGEVVDSNNMLNILMNGTKNPPVPPKDIPAFLSFKLSLIKKEIEKYATTLQETQRKLFTDMGEDQVDPKGNKTGQKVIKQESREKYEKEMEKILEEECSIDFKPMELKEFDGIEVTGSFFMVMSWLIKE